MPRGGIPFGLSIQQEYEVERIIKSRYESSLNTFVYYIKWKGYNDSFNTWEPVWNLGNAKQSLSEFLEKQKVKKERELKEEKEEGDDSEDETYLPSSFKKTLTKKQTSVKQGATSRKRRAQQTISTDMWELKVEESDNQNTASTANSSQQAQNANALSELPQVTPINSLGVDEEVQTCGKIKQEFISIIAQESVNQSQITTPQITAPNSSVRAVTVSEELASKCVTETSFTHKKRKKKHPTQKRPPPEMKQQQPVDKQLSSNKTPRKRKTKTNKAITSSSTSSSPSPSPQVKREFKTKSNLTKDKTQSTNNNDSLPANIKEEYIGRFLDKGKPKYVIRKLEKDGKGSWQFNIQEQVNVSIANHTKTIDETLELIPPKIVVNYLLKFIS